ncbi:MAG TPA: hypothetical protein VFY00_04585 [Arenimonas sp.]|nr:hypothetical protein [Arenimonas sp.]
MTKRRSLVLAALAALTGCVLVLAFWHRSGPEGVAPGDMDAAAADSSDRQPSPAPARPTPASDLPLPPLEMPLALALASLEAQAEAGVPAAACRLAAEFQNCLALKARREEMADWLSERRRAFELVTANGQDTRLVDTFQRTFEEQLAQRENGLAAHERRCEGVALPDEAGLLRRWRQAALLGDPTAMRYYASGTAFRWSNVLAAPDVQAAYRSEAASMAWSLARQGDLLMTLRLASATSSLTRYRPGLLDEVVEDDPALALALYRRVLWALKQDDRPDATRLRNEIRLRIDLIRQVATPEQIGDAARRLRDLDAWDPLSTQGLGRGTHLDGARLPASPAACQHAGRPEADMPG